MGYRSYNGYNNDCPEKHEDCGCDQSPCGLQMVRIVAVTSETLFAYGTLTWLGGKHFLLISRDGGTTWYPANDPTGTNPTRWLYGVLPVDADGRYLWFKGSGLMKSPEAAASQQSRAFFVHSALPSGIYRTENFEGFDAEKISGMNATASNFCTSAARGVLYDGERFNTPSVRACTPSGSTTRTFKQLTGIAGLGTGLARIDLTDDGRGVGLLDGGGLLCTEDYWQSAVYALQGVFDALAVPGGDVWIQPKPSWPHCCGLRPVAARWRIDAAGRKADCRAIAFPGMVAERLLLADGMAAVSGWLHAEIEAAALPDLLANPNVSHDATTGWGTAIISMHERRELAGAYERPILSSTTAAITRQLITPYYGTVAVNPSNWSGAKRISEKCHRRDNACAALRPVAVTAGEYTRLYFMHKNTNGTWTATVPWGDEVPYEPNVSGGAGVYGHVADFTLLENKGMAFLGAMRILDERLQPNRDKCRVFEFVDRSGEKSYRWYQGDFRGFARYGEYGDYDRSLPSAERLKPYPISKATTSRVILSGDAIVYQEDAELRYTDRVVESSDHVIGTIDGTLRDFIGPVFRTTTGRFYELADDLETVTEIELDDEERAAKQEEFDRDADYFDMAITIRDCVRHTRDMTAIHDFNDGDARSKFSFTPLVADFWQGVDVNLARIWKDGIVAIRDDELIIVSPWGSDDYVAIERDEDRAALSEKRPRKVEAVPEGLFLLFDDRSLYFRPFDENRFEFVRAGVVDVTAVTRAEFTVSGERSHIDGMIEKTEDGGAGWSAETVFYHGMKFFPEAPPTPAERNLVAPSYQAELNPGLGGVLAGKSTATGAGFYDDDCRSYRPLGDWRPSVDDSFALKTEFTYNTPLPNGNMMSRALYGSPDRDLVFWTKKQGAATTAGLLTRRGESVNVRDPAPTGCFGCKPGFLKPAGERRPVAGGIRRDDRDPEPYDAGGGDGELYLTFYITIPAATWYYGIDYYNRDDEGNAIIYDGGGQGGGIAVEGGPVLHALSLGTVLETPYKQPGDPNLPGIGWFLPRVRERFLGYMKGSKATLWDWFYHTGPLDRVFGHAFLTFRRTDHGWMNEWFGGSETAMDDYLWSFFKFVPAGDREIDHHEESGFFPKNVFMNSEHAYFFDLQFNGFQE